MKNQRQRLSIFPASRDEAETQALARVPYVLVSVRDPDMPPPAFHNSEFCRGVLLLAFDDAEPMDDELDDIRLMTIKDAEAIWAFVIEHLPDVGAVAVHCEQGVSRSPAIAAGLLLGFGLSAGDIFDRDRYRPNPYVLRLMLQARESWVPRANFSTR
jgi:predicted protein tyrosine phosphatase